MKFAMIAIATLIAGFANASQSDLTIKGDKIIFQKESAYVSAAYDKSLCLAGNTFKAVVTKCVATAKNASGNDVCVQTAKVAATQPVKSTAQRCVEFTGSDKQNCAKWETYALVQSPVRNVQWINESHTVVKTATITIPACK